MTNSGLSTFGSRGKRANASLSWLARRASSLSSQRRYGPSGRSASGVDAGLYDPGLAVALDFLEEGLASARELEGMDHVPFVDGYNDSVGLPDHAGKLRLRLPDVAAQALTADGVDRARVELRLYVLPTQEASGLAACGVHPFR